MDSEGETLKNKVIDKYMKIVTKGGRILIGRCKSIDYSGFIYLTDAVEAFDNNSEFKKLIYLFDNQDEHCLYFNTEKYNYQICSNCVVYFNDISKINILKE